VKTSAQKVSPLRILGTIIALGLLVYLLSQQGWREILAALHQLPTWRLLGAAGLMLISRICVANRWHVLLRAADLKIARRETLRITFAGLFASNFLPTTIGGDVVRLAGAVQLRYDAAICAASLIADRLVGMAGMIMAAPFGLPSLFSSLPGAASLAPGGAQAAASIGWVSLLSPGGETGYKQTTQNPKQVITGLWQRGKYAVQKAFGATQLWFKHPSSLGISLLFTWMNMLCLFGVLKLILDGLELADQGVVIPFWQVAGLYSLVYFVTLIPISINGYGVQELSMTLVFANLAGASVNSSLTTALLFRTLMMLASLPGAFFIPGILAAREHTNLEDVDLHEDIERGK
jgi:glycosyltransferase 2 family protein